MEGSSPMKPDYAQFLPEPTVLPAGPTQSNPMEAKPNAMVFFHIPLQQAYKSAIDSSPSRHPLVIGERIEAAGASKTDSGFFDAVLAQGELLAKPKEAVVDEFWDGEYSAPTAGRPEVKVLAHGHCHLSSVRPSLIHDTHSACSSCPSATVSGLPSSRGCMAMFRRRRHRESTLSPCLCSHTQRSLKTDRLSI